MARFSYHDFGRKGILPNLRKNVVSVKIMFHYMTEMLQFTIYIVHVDFSKKIFQISLYIKITIFEIQTFKIVLYEKI